MLLVSTMTAFGYEAAPSSPHSPPKRTLLLISFTTFEHMGGTYPPHLICQQKKSARLNYMSAVALQAVIPIFSRGDYGVNTHGPHLHYPMGGGTPSTWPVDQTCQAHHFEVPPPPFNI